MELKDKSEIPKLILASGKSYETPYMVTGEKMCFIRIRGHSFAEIATDFSDPWQTTEMIYRDNLYTGYTHLVSLRDENGVIRIELSKL